MLEKKKNNSSKDLLWAAVLFVVCYFLASSFEFFENIYSITRAHENWELDELILILFVAPIPLSWYSFRMSRKVSAEVHQRILVEQALAKSSKMKSLGALAGGVAHEINNQLLPIISMAELVRDRMDADNPDCKKLDLILKASSNAQATVGKILSYARGGTNTKEYADLDGLWETLKPLLETLCPANINLKLDVAQCNGAVNMSEADLQGILVNLFTNAAQAIGNTHGAIVFTVITGQKGDGNSNSFVDSEVYVKISVRDDGPGIDKKNHLNIFDPFFTTKPPGEGVGLGLSIAHTLVENAGGRMVHLEEVVDGCQFDIWLPLHQIISERKVEKESFPC